MTLPTHCLLGLIIGKLTGQYTAALVGSLFMDVDHLPSYVRHGLLGHPKKMLQVALKSTDEWGDQRGIFHNAFVAAPVVAAVSVLWPFAGWAFGLAYVGHLVLDALDGSGYVPFSPLWRYSLRGPVTYATWREWALSTVLLGLYCLMLSNRKW